MTISQITLMEAISKLPDTEPFSLEKSDTKSYDFFFAALGFEERTLSIPKAVAEHKFSFQHTVYFQYETSTFENAYNEPKLLESFKKTSGTVSKLFCDEPNFLKLLADLISKTIVERKGPAKVMFDISVCASRLILSVIKTLMDLDIELTLVYTEAEIYFPLFDEYSKNALLYKQKNAASNEQVVLNSDFPGGNKTNPDLIISFPNFKAQRAHNIISEIDETILLKPDDRLVWIIGSPNMNDSNSENRKSMMLEINDISKDAKIYEVSTLYYKKTIEKLEFIYQNNNWDYHINISDLGSKMQTLGIALFCLIRQEVSVYHTLPKTYGNFKYSQGAQKIWKIEFGLTNELMKIVNMIDKISIS